MIKAIAIDDEPYALQVLQSHAEKVNNLEMVQVFTDASLAKSFFQNGYADVVFLDINMPDISGIAIAEALHPDIQVVFTTAHSEYAVKGFEMNATDYLLKPVSFIRFMQAYYKVAQRKKQPTTNVEPFLKDGKEWIKLNPANILYIEAAGNYVNIIQSSGKQLIRSTLNDISELLNDDFIRVHKSYIINRNFIERIDASNISIGIHKIPVGKTFKDELFKALGLKDGVDAI